MALFFLANEASLANCFLCGGEATLSTWKTHCVQASLLKPPPFCKIFAGFGSTNKTVTSLPFTSCPCYASLFLISYILWDVWQKLFSLFSFSTIRLQWVPGHLFLLGNDTSDKLASGVRCSSHQLSHVVSLPLPLVFTLLFCRTGGVLS